MRTINKIKLISALVFICTILCCLPQSSMAQRFNHGGGGGRPAGGGVARPSGGGNFGGGRGGGFNGGSRSEGNHAVRVFGGGGAGRGWGGNRGGDWGRVHNENVYHHVYGYRPYYYHPYHPHIWGPYWHPFGFFCAALTADAIMLSYSGVDYWYDNGVYYQPYNNGYTAVAPPIGAVVGYLPAGYETVTAADGNYYYYYGGVFYISQGGSFLVVQAPLGAIVSEIPEGAAQQVINGETYMLYNNTYFQPVSMNGQDAYEVVQVQ